MRRWLVLAFLLLAAAWVLGRLGWRALRGEEVTLVTVVEGRVVSAVYATGRVDTDRRATVRCRLTAPLAALLVGDGEAVKEGQVLARQDATAMGLERERAEREMEAARAAQAEAEDAAARAEKLVADGLLAEDAWVRAREGAREAVARRAASESALTLAREREGWVELRSPLDGIVSALHHRAGDALTEGDEVVSVVDLGPAYLRVAVDERDLGKIAAGQQVRLVFDAYPDRLLEGSVWRTVPSVDRLTKSVDVLVSLPEERPPLQLDLTATVNVITSVVEQALVVPRDALLGAGAQRLVLLVDEDGRAASRAVVVGVCDEQRCQVSSGLVLGERVISPAPPGLQAGDRVHAR